MKSRMLKDEEFDFESELDDVMIGLIPLYQDINVLFWRALDVFEKNDRCSDRGLCFPDIERSIGRLETKGKIRRIWEVVN